MFELATFLAQATELLAQDGITPYDFGKMGVGIGIGLIIVGVGLGIGRIGGSAVEAMARQPEAGGRIQTAMIIAAALIEGVAVIALVFMLIS